MKPSWIKSAFNRSWRAQIANAKLGKVSLRILLVNLHAKRAAERDEVLTHLQSAKTCSMIDTFAANEALFIKIFSFRYHGAIHFGGFSCQVIEVNADVRM